MTSTINISNNPFDPYGYDLDLFTDFTNDLRSTGGPKVVINDIISMLIDNLWYDTEGNLDIELKLRRSDPRTYPGIATQVENGILTDDRVDYCTCTIEGPNPLGVVEVLINVVLSTGDKFELVGSLDSFSVSSDFTFLTR